MGMKQVRDRPYLLDRIDRTQFRHLRDIDRLRLRMVANAKITQVRTDQLGRQLTIGRRDGHDRATRHPGRSATLIDIDMSRLRAQDTIERAGYRLQGHRVRSRTIKQEKRFGHLAKNNFQLTCRGLGPRIVAVANRMIIIRLDHRFQNPGVNAGVIVTRETSHLLLSLVANFKLTTKIRKDPPFAINTGAKKPFRQLPEGFTTTTHYLINNPDFGSFSDSATRYRYGSRKR